MPHKLPISGNKLFLFLLLLWCSIVTGFSQSGIGVAGWGWNLYGQATAPGGLGGISALAAGYRFSLALRTNASLAAWGDLPIGSGAISNVTAIAAGVEFAMALKSDGTVLTWGDNSYGQTNVPPDLTNVVAIAAGTQHSLALKADGTVVAWGLGSSGQTAIPSGLSNVLAVAAGNYYSMALKNNGTLTVWGSMNNSVTENLSNVVAIASGYEHGLALTADGMVVGFGWNTSYQATPPPGLSNVTAIAAFSNHSLALKDDGTVVAWGDNNVGMSDVPTNLSKVIGIAAGGQHSLALVGNGKVVIVQQPLNRIVHSGQDAIFSIGAVGNPPLRYQWKRGLQVLNGETNSILKIINAQPSDMGFYGVVVSDASGSAISSNAYLKTLLSPPLVLTPPTNQTSWLGLSAIFHVTASGSLPLAYQWQFNGINLDGATNASLTLTNLQTEQQGDYRAVVSNAYGVVESPGGHLDVLGFKEALNAPELSWTTSGDLPWFITTNPSRDREASAQVGDVVGSQQKSTLQTVVTGPGTLKFWWYTTIENSLYPVSLGLYANGKMQAQLGSSSYTWVEQTCYLGSGSQTLQWTYTNTYPFAGWNIGWLDQVSFLPGATSPLLLASPISQSGAISSNVTFSVTAAGTPPLDYQWFFNESPLNEGTNSSLPLANLQTNQAGTYRVVVSNPYGFTNSALATLTVTSPPPTLLTQPFAPLAWPGSSATLRVNAAAPTPLAYQWRLNGTNLLNATNPSLTLVNLQFSNSGNYTVVVTNTGGAITSANAQIVVSQVVPWGGQSVVPQGLSNAVAAAGGGFHSLALRANGRVTVWGNNTYGQTNIPPTLTNTASIAAGLYHSLALRSNTTLSAWGQSTYGQTSAPSTATNVSAIAAGWYHSLALKNDGTVIAWGAGTSPFILPPHFGQSLPPTNLTGVVRIAAGGYHSLALRTNGSVVAWGWNASGQTNVPLGLTGVVAIAAGGSNSLALKGDGTVVAWGANSYGQSSVPAGLSNVVAISAGAAHTLALQADGALAMWGFNSTGQTVLPAGLTNITQISAGGFHTLALLNNGEPWEPARFPNQSVASASSLTLIAGVVGAWPMTYQWQFNGTNLQGATNTFLRLVNLPLTAAGNYACVVTNTFGAITNLSAVLSVLRSTPRFSNAVNLTPTTTAWQLANLSGHGPIVILASSNLLDWTPILTNPPATGSILIEDSDQTNQPTRFYRAVEW